MSEHAPRSRRAPRVPKRKIARLIEAVQGAGLNVANVRVEPDGTIEVTPVIPGTTPPRSNARKGGSVDNFRDIADVL
jgi:hypothetical protein